MALPEPEEQKEDTMQVDEQARKDGSSVSILESEKL